MGASFAVIRLCHVLEASRRLRMSVRGNDDRISTCSSFGRAKNNRSKGELI